MRTALSTPGHFRPMQIELFSRSFNDSDHEFPVCPRRFCEQKKEIASFGTLPAKKDSQIGKESLYRHRQQRSLIAHPHDREPHDARRRFCISLPTANAFHSLDGTLEHLPQFRSNPGRSH
jgi:hypothetical protein